MNAKLPGRFEIHPARFGGQIDHNAPWLKLCQHPARENHRGNGVEHNIVVFVFPADGIRCDGTAAAQLNPGKIPRTPGANRYLRPHGAQHLRQRPANPAIARDKAAAPQQRALIFLHRYRHGSFRRDARIADGKFLPCVIIININGVPLFARRQNRSHASPIYLLPAHTLRKRIIQNDRTVSVGSVDRLSVRRGGKRENDRRAGFVNLLRRAPFHLGIQRQTVKPPDTDGAAVLCQRVGESGLPPVSPQKPKAVHLYHDYLKPFSSRRKRGKRERCFRPCAAEKCSEISFTT